MTQAIHLPENGRFSCRSCGQCCQGWAVPVDQATASRLRTHDWGSDPFERDGVAGNRLRIRLVDGRCFFLDAQNRCRIHSEFSYDAKPDACRAFPLAFTDIDGDRYGRLSYWCPTVIANDGKPLEQQTRWVKDSARHAEQHPGTLRIGDTARITVHELDPLHRTLRAIMSAARLTVGNRLAAAAAMVQRLESASDRTATMTALARDARAPEGTMALAQEGRRGGSAAAGRRMLALYLLDDTAAGGRFSQIPRLASVMLFGGGLLRLRSRTVNASASWRQIRRVTFQPSDSSNELLTRYFCSKVDSRRYLAGDTLVSGFNRLVAAYGILNVLARMHAAAAGRTAIADEDVHAGVRAAEKLVLEHRVEEAATLRERVTHLVLGNAALCSDVLAQLQEG